MGTFRPSATGMNTCTAPCRQQQTMGAIVQDVLFPPIDEERVKLLGALLPSIMLIRQWRVGIEYVAFQLNTHSNGCQQHILSSISSKSLPGACPQQSASLQSTSDACRPPQLPKVRRVLVTPANRNKAHSCPYDRFETLCHYSKAYHHMSGSMPIGSLSLPS